MNCQIALKNGDSIMVNNFNCVEYRLKSNDDMKIFEPKDIENLNLIDDITYTILGATIVKVKGEQILYFHFK
ncbi:hypothetical protein [Staphylococcus gallinarum]|uniref:hypothetical protein n=1 Tax=Staphylococcus gallinarum TaxID=1293 RepID=UPI000D1CA674|nr:hypothetical protein [Staphylococcus gallinarum]MBU7217494.1 hypothetical protein [Staphylococcus gallinarum]MCD8794178.1 hypothetical protein [Staphylococcus gallinarum]PTE27554.1 hypothetical protein BUZ00_14200 [Staphylococcus gallinarum]PTK89461.1 hypothetical protein BUZ03_11110 [Staphylococcus gallinarum]RIL22393.1 hypothetical protein BUY99_06850 [Staphylococcus gallinarum]